MCPLATIRVRRCGWLAAGLLAAGLLNAQAPPAAPLGTSWRSVGGVQVELGLNSPAGGRVLSAVFAPDGDRLAVETLPGKWFETQDFETWRPLAAPPAARVEKAEARRLPENGAVVVSAGAGSRALFALGKHLYRSFDGGISWNNLTRAGDRSVIGAAPLAVAISPVNEDQIVAANRYGVWRSLDGGASWSGLNERLPNLHIRRILSTPGPKSQMEAIADGVGPLRRASTAAAPWVESDVAVSEEDAGRTRAARALGASISAYAESGDTAWAGGADGRLWVSVDRGAAWRLSRATTGAAPVSRIWAHAADPNLALAVMSGPTARILRTTNRGQFWDDLSANLPDGEVYGVDADPATGAVYAATAKGLFLSRQDLVNLAPAAPWSPVRTAVPGAAVLDVKLDSPHRQVFVSLEGYGVYVALGPHLRWGYKVLSAADYSDRAAAPGSLLSVLGAKLSAAKADALDAPVLAAYDGESQIQVPFEATGASLPLSFVAEGKETRYPMPLRPASPAIFVDPDGAPVIQDAASGLLLHAGNPARSGARIQVLASGLGRVEPSWPTGTRAPLENPPRVIAPVRATIDRVAVNVTRATLAPGYVGYYLVEIELPSLADRGPAELAITAGEESSNRVTLYIEP